MTPEFLRTVLRYEVNLFGFFEVFDPGAKELFDLLWSQTLLQVLAHFCPSCHLKIGGGVWSVVVCDFLNFNPHLHIIATDGCFYDQDVFMVGPQPAPKALGHAFRLEVFKMFRKEGQILGTVIDNMHSWQL